MSDWKTLSSEPIYETPWIKVRRDEVLNHNGKPLTYSVVELQNPSVLIVAERNGKILLQKNYHYTLDETVWEIPAGNAETGENALTAAKRELLEETGLVSSDWTELGKYYHIIGIGNLPFHVFLARDVQDTDAKRDKDEQITSQQFLSQKEIASLAASGEFAEGGHIAAVYLATIHGI